MKLRAMDLSWQEIVVDAGGHLVPTLGSVNFNVCYQRREVALVDVSVIKDVGYPLIFGQDWMAAVGEVRIAHHAGVGFQVNLGGVEGPNIVEDEGNRVGLAVRADNSTGGEYSEHQQPAEAPTADETVEAPGEATKLLDAECRELRREKGSSCRMRVRSEAVVMSNVLAHLEVEAE